MTERASSCCRRAATVISREAQGRRWQKLTEADVEGLDRQRAGASPRPIGPITLMAALTTVSRPGSARSACGGCYRAHAFPRFLEPRKSRREGARDGDPRSLDWR